MYSNFREKLSAGKFDASVGISIFELVKGKAVSSFGTRMEAGKKVGCHSHEHGDEWYIILNGNGTIYLGDVCDNGMIVNKREFPVTKGSVFVIPEKTAHQLKADTQLDLIFMCPASHLENDRCGHVDLV